MRNLLIGFVLGVVLSLLLQFRPVVASGLCALHLPSSKHTFAMLACDIHEILGD